MLSFTDKCRKNILLIEMSPLWSIWIWLALWFINLIIWFTKKTPTGTTKTKHTHPIRSNMLSTRLQKPTNVTSFDRFDAYQIYFYPSLTLFFCISYSLLFWFLHKTLNHSSFLKVVSPIFIKKIYLVYFKKMHVYTIYKTSSFDPCKKFFLKSF